MSKLNEILENNKGWVGDMVALDKTYFDKMALGQSPEYLWIGCSDSRVAANVLAGLNPGEVFVHRNVANVFYPGDNNLSAVLQYSVEVLKVKRIIVCGHYGCGGVAAALTGEAPVHVDAWLSPIREVIRSHREELDEIEEFQQKWDRLAELNALAQVENVKKFPSVVEATHDLTVHAVIYGVGDGLLKEL